MWSVEVHIVNLQQTYILKSINLTYRKRRAGEYGHRPVRSYQRTCNCPCHSEELLICPDHGPTCWDWSVIETLPLRFQTHRLSKTYGRPTQRTTWRRHRQSCHMELCMTVQRPPCAPCSSAEVLQCKLNMTTIMINRCAIIAHRKYNNIVIISDKRIDLLLSTATCLEHTLQLSINLCNLNNNQFFISVNR